MLEHGSSQELREHKKTAWFEEGNPSKTLQECWSDKLLLDPLGISLGRALRQTSFKCALKFHQVGTSRKPFHQLPRARPAPSKGICRLYSLYFFFSIAPE